MLNRNIVTAADIVNAMSAQTPQQMPKTFDTNPPAAVATALAAGSAPGFRGGGGAPAAAPGGVAVPTEDDFLTKVIKYLPVEVIGFYLFVEGVIDSNVSKHGDRSWWLGILLLLTLGLTWLYDRRVLNVVRRPQALMSVVGMAVYVFAAGGWFGTTTWYHQWYGSIVVPVFAMAIAVLRIAPLPPAG